jgi:hypothetical protein
VAVVALVAFGEWQVRTDQSLLPPVCTYAPSCTLAVRQPTQPPCLSLPKVPPLLLLHLFLFFFFFVFFFFSFPFHPPALPCSGRVSALVIPYFCPSPVLCNMLDLRLLQRRWCAACVSMWSVVVCGSERARRLRAVCHLHHHVPVWGHLKQRARWLVAVSLLCTHFP